MDKLEYDNDSYRDERKTAKVDRIFVLKTLLISCASLLFVLLLDRTFVAASKPEWWLTRIVLEGSLVAILISLIAYGVRGHSLNKKAPLKIGKEGIVIGSQRKSYRYSDIDRVEVRRGYVRFVLRNPVGKAKSILLQSEYIWNFQRFKEILERYCVVEDRRRL